LKEDKYIDLRSDTVTVPCERMRKVMYAAEVGDNYYREDKITNQLEAYCASYLKKESALFLISGTMANQVAIRSYLNPGDEIITDKSYHLNYYESSATSNLSGASFNLISSNQGIISADDFEKAIQSRYRSPLTKCQRLLVLENTINYYSGKVFSIDAMVQLREISINKNIPIYLDGARLINACVATNRSIEDYSILVDSLMISFSKGLGAPAGAILAGSHDFIQQARIYQKNFGGGFHQSGIIASAALFALENNVDTLISDQKKARLLAETICQSSEIIIDLDEIQTNIVMFSLRSICVDKFIMKAKEQGILLYRWSDNIIRAVLHHDVSTEQVCYAADKIITISL